MPKVNVDIVSHATRVGSLHKRIMFPEEWKELLPAATTPRFLEWCDRESVNAGKACVVAMTLLDLLLRKLMEVGTDEQVQGFDVQKCVSAGLSYCKLSKSGRSASHLQEVQCQIEGVVPPGCAPIDDQTAAYLRNHITRNVMLLYSRDAVWKHVENCLRAVFVKSKVSDRDVVLRRVQCGTPLKEGISVSMMKWLDTAGVIEHLKELHKYERSDDEEGAEEENGQDEEEEEGGVPAPKKKRVAKVKRRDDEKDKLLTGLKMVNHLVVLSSRVRFKLLSAMARETCGSVVSSTNSEEVHLVLKRWKRFSFVPVMKTSRVFVTVDKLSVRSFLKACARADELEFQAAGAEESRARVLAAEEKASRKQLAKQRIEEEKARRAARAEWVDAQMKGRKRARGDTKNKSKKQW